MMRVVGVHGVGNYLADSATQAAQSKTAEWRSALMQSEHMTAPPPQFDLRVAYYAHHLRPPGRQGTSELDADMIELWRDFVADYLPLQPQGPVRSTLHFASAAMARAIGLNQRATVSFLELFFREVAAFLRTEGSFTPKQHVLSDVGASIAGADVVVAHSLGSLVAYEALWKYRTEIPLLITLGSPLAMPMIFPRLTPGPIEKLGSRPPGVKRWVNIADPEDFVAIPRLGISRHFKNVDEDCHDGVDTILRHEVDKYLQGAEFGRILTTFLLMLADHPASDGSI
jgi:hypothetical protein